MPTLVAPLDCLVRASAPQLVYKRSCIYVLLLLSISHPLLPFLLSNIDIILITMLGKNFLSECGVDGSC